MKLITVIVFSQESILTPDYANRELIASESSDSGYSPAYLSYGDGNYISKYGQPIIYNWTGASMSPRNTQIYTPNESLSYTVTKAGWISVSGSISPIMQYPTTSLSRSNVTGLQLPSTPYETYVVGVLLYRNDSTNNSVPTRNGIIGPRPYANYSVNVSGFQGKSAGSSQFFPVSPGDVIYYGLLQEGALGAYALPASYSISFIPGKILKSNP